jgi:hypothetical protein
MLPALGYFNLRTDARIARLGVNAGSELDTHAKHRGITAQNRPAKLIGTLCIVQRQ